MTKEQVQLHGEIIKWFCDNPDKGVWVRDKSDDIWSINTTPEWSIYNIYVQNDKYHEFRKALVDGKTVQFNPMTQYHNRWDNIKVIRPGICDTVKNYRIKPEKPKFKVGDWVYSNRKYSRYDDKPGQITSIKNNGDCYIKNKGGAGGWEFSPTELKHWQPKPDEYVWYGYELVQVIDNSDTIKICRQDSDSYEEVTLDKLEPFIGELPSFIKDKQ